MSMEKDFDELTKWSIKVEVILSKCHKVFYCEKVNYGTREDYDMILMDVVHISLNKEEKYETVRVPKWAAIVYGEEPE